MKEIIFVCLGNICRSPMAEMMMRQLVNNQNLEGEIKVKSRATSTYEIGNPPHPGAIAELKKHKVPIVSHTAKQISELDFRESDFIVGMDKQNIIDLKKMAPISEEKKIHMAYELFGEDIVIEDPWYDHKFDRTYKQLAKVLPVWLEKLRS